MHREWFSENYRLDCGFEQAQVDLLEESQELIVQVARPSTQIEREVEIVTKAQEREREEVSLQRLKLRLIQKMQQAGVPVPADKTVA